MLELVKYGSVARPSCSKRMTDVAEIASLIPGERDHLSVLKAADKNSITYYVGETPEHVSHLRDCTLLCKPGFAPDLEGVDLIPCDNPQLSFYRLSHSFKINYLDYSAMVARDGARIHPDAVIPDSCVIGPGCVIGNCTLGENVIIEANCVIYSKTEILEDAHIESNTVIGATGVMWVWDGKDRVFLEQLGGVKIGKGCFIGSNVSIVRGSANEVTTIGSNTCMAHGTKIGHGSQIGEFNHFANNVSIGGSVVSGRGCFFGSGSTVPPGKILGDEVIVGAGAVITKNIPESGVYSGVPALRMGDIKEGMSGIPAWNQKSLKAPP